MLSDKEIWRSVVGFAGRYEVSSLGRVRSWAKSWRTVGESGALVLTPYLSHKGYPKVHMSLRPTRSRTAFVHRLVLEAFVGPVPEGHEAAHLNGDKQDARLVNLRWVTHKENETHKRRHGTLLCGEQCNLSTLTEAEVLEIRRLKAAGAATMDVAARFGVTTSAIRKIVSGKRWVGLLNKREAA